MRVDDEKKGDGVRFDHENYSNGVRVHDEKDHMKEQWGESSP